MIDQIASFPLGHAPGCTYGNGCSLPRSHDLDHRPSTIHDAATGGLSLHYHYDTADQLIELEDGP